MVATVTMADNAGKTRYIATVRHWSAEDRDAHQKMAFYDGWDKATDQLEELAKTLQVKIAREIFASSLRWSRRDAEPESSYKLIASRKICVNGLPRMSPSFGAISFICGVTMCASSDGLSAQLSKVRKRPGSPCTSSSA